MTRNGAVLLLLVVGMAAAALGVSAGIALDHLIRHLGEALQNVGGAQ